MRLRSIAFTVALAACGSGQNEGPGSVQPAVHTLTVQVTGEGRVTSVPAGIDCVIGCSDCGTTCSATFTQPVTLTATPAPSATFPGWEGACSGASACVLTMSADASVKAGFQPRVPPPAQSQALRVVVQGSGTVTSSPAGIDCGAACSARFASGAQVALTATAASGSRFAGWSGPCSGTQGCSVTMSSDLEVTATFQEDPPPPPVDECDGLLPASLPAPVSVSLSHSGCAGGTSDDGVGNFVLGHLIPAEGPSYPIWEFFALQGGAAVRVGGTILGGAESLTEVSSQPSGFSVFSEGQFGGSNLTFYSHEGAITSQTSLASSNPADPPGAAAGVDPSGGVAVVRMYVSAGNPINEYRRFSKTGVAETSWVRIDEGRSSSGLAVGVALSGHALVFKKGYPNWMGRWFDRDGTPMTEWFGFKGDFNAGELHFLADGGLAARSHPDGEYSSRFEDGKTTDKNFAPSPLPGWLQTRAANQFSVIRFGRGYASWGAAGTCPGALEVLSSSGKSCGCLSVPSLSRGASIGRDGSLIVPREAGTCKYDLYPQLLK